MEHPSRVALPAARGRQRVRDGYSFERMVREFERIYLEVLEEAARRPRPRGGAPVRRASGEV